jgi:L-threonylcarbamoyladenylate synthase
VKTSVLSLSQQNDEAVSAALKAVQQGEVILFPTESVYGLGVVSDQPEAAQKLYELKGRPSEKPFQWLTHDVRVVQNFSKWSSQAKALARQFWPGPLTMVLEDKTGGSVGWRIPRHDWLLNFLTKLNQPLIATSANLSGQPTPKEFEAALQPFRDQIQLAIDGGTIEMGVPSTVISIKGSSLQILRQGAIAQQEILKHASI